MLGPHPAQFGAVCLAAVLPLAIFGLPVVSANERSFWIWIVVGIFCFGVATLLRQAIGLMGVVAGCSAVAVNFVLHAPRGRRALMAGVALMAAIVISYQTPLLVSQARNFIYHLPPATLLEQHGVWHNLYIGLGAADNPFGIVWDDDSAVRAARHADTTAIYGSARYFAVLRDEYFQVLRQHPIEVAGVYLRKLRIIFETPFPWPLEELRLGDALAVLFFAAVYFRALLRHSRSGLFAADAVFAIALLFTMFFIAQGVLFHYKLLYLFPVHLFLLIGAGAIAEFFRLGFTDPIAAEPSTQPAT
jgi:hypothetical protein